MRVVGLQLPGSAVTVHGRVLDSLSLGLGKRGRDPEIVLSTDAPFAVIDTHLDLCPDSTGTFTVDGPYVRDRGGCPGLELRWGTRTPGGHFLLMSGVQLCLPTLAVSSRRQRRPRSTQTLTATVGLSDATGGPLCGVLEAAALHWRLAPRSSLGRGAVAGTEARGGVISSTA